MSWIVKLACNIMGRELRKCVRMCATAHTCHQSLVQLQQHSRWTAPLMSDTKCRIPPETWWPGDTCMCAGGTVVTHLPACEHGSPSLTRSSIAQAGG